MIRARRSKYGVRLDAEGKRARTVDGTVFASLKEARRYGELLMLLKAGEISNLGLQPGYRICVRTPTGDEVKVAMYYADFSFWRDGVQVIEDVKSSGTRTNAVYRLKKKLVEAIYGIEVLET